jgi:hypothetical protein
MTLQELSKQIRVFIRDYVRAFDTFDSVTIASFYNIPCVAVRGDGSVYCLSHDEELNSFFHKIVGTYRQEGWQHFRYRNLEVTAIGTQSALASVDWQMLRNDGSLVRRWRQSYNLLRIGSQWKILASTIHRSRQQTTARTETAKTRPTVPPVARAGRRGH